MTDYYMTPGSIPSAVPGVRSNLQRTQVHACAVQGSSSETTGDPTAAAAAIRPWPSVAGHAASSTVSPTLRWLDGCGVAVRAVGSSYPTPGLVSWTGSVPVGTYTRRYTP